MSAFAALIQKQNEDFDKQLQLEKKTIAENNLKIALKIVEDYVIKNNLTALKSCFFNVCTYYVDKDMNMYKTSVCGTSNPKFTLVIGNEKLKILEYNSM